MDINTLIGAVLGGALLLPGLGFAGAQVVGGGEGAGTADVQTPAADASGALEGSADLDAVADLDAPPAPDVPSIDVPDLPATPELPDAAGAVTGTVDTAVDIAGEADVPDAPDAPTAPDTGDISLPTIPDVPVPGLGDDGVSLDLNSESNTSVELQQGQAQVDNQRSTTGRIRGLWNSSS